MRSFFDTPNASESWESTDALWLTSSAITPVDLQFRVAGIYNKRQLLTHLPPKVDLDRYVTTWFNVVDSARLMVHAPTFQREYVNFWHDPSTVSPSWLGLLFSVASLGAEVSGQAQQDPVTLAQAEEMRRLASHSFVLADYAAPQPYIIEGLLLLIKSLLLKYHDTVSESWLLMGLIASLCVQAGYHRDPATNSAVAPFACEMRRRTWAFVREYDIGMSYQLGLVSIINQQKADTKAPANLFDTDFSIDSVPLGRPLEDITPMSFSLAYQQLVFIGGDIIYSALSPSEGGEPTVVRLAERLDQARNELPTQLRMVPLEESILETPHRILDRYRLEIYYHKFRCILYRRYLTTAGHDRERQRCTDSAERIVKLVLSILEASQPGGQLSACVVFTRRHIHDSNLASMVLCWDLKRVSKLDGATEQQQQSAMRRRKLLLHASTLWQASGVPSTKARFGLQAVLTFLQQQMDTPGDSDNPSASNSVASSNQARATGMSNGMNSMDPSATFADLAMGMPFSQPGQALPGAAPANLEFLDIFGPTYSGHEDFQLDWP